MKNKFVDFDKEFYNLIMKKLSSLEILQHKLIIENKYSDDYYKLMSRVAKHFNKFIMNLKDRNSNDFFKIIHDFLYQRSTQVNSQTLFAESSALNSLIMQQKVMRNTGKYFKRIFGRMLSDVTRDSDLTHYKLKDRKVSEVNIPSKEELVKILGNATGKTRAIIAFLIISGLNVNEMINIQIKDFDTEIESDEVKIRISSIRAEKIVFMTKSFIMYICMTFHGTCDLDQFDKDEFLFVSQKGNQLDRNNVYMMIKRAGKKGKIDNLKSQVFNQIYTDIVDGKDTEAEQLLMKNKAMFRVKRFENFKGSLIDFQKALQLSRKNYEIESENGEEK